MELRISCMFMGVFWGGPGGPFPAPTLPMRFARTGGSFAPAPGSGEAAEFPGSNPSE